MASSINASTSGGGGVIVSSDATGNLNLQSGGTTVVAVTSTGMAVTGVLSATGTLGVTGAITGSSTVAGSTGILYPLTSGTAVASTSGTSIDFTSIPSWVKRITVMFSGVSTSGVSSPLIQLGSGSPTTSGYLGVGSRWTVNNTSETAFTTGLGLNGVSAAYLYRGAIVFNLLGSNAWIGVANMSETSANIMFMSTTSVTLSGTLDRVRITTVNGTDAFDAGSINILYE